MAITKAFNRSVWAQEVLFALRSQLVSNNLTNDKYSGDVVQGGSVNIFTPDAVSVSTYDGSDLTAQEADGDDQTMPIDQADSFLLTFNDISQLQTNVDLQTAFMNESGYALADAYDKYIFSLYSGAASANEVDATTANGSGWDKDTIYDALVAGAKALDDQGVPNGGRYSVLGPAGYSYLRKSAEFTAASDLGDMVKMNGSIGEVAGFSIFKSRNISSGSSYRYPLFGHTSAITAASQINKVEQDRTPKNFKDIIKGLHVYGAKVVRPNALGYFKVDK